MLSLSSRIPSSSLLQRVNEVLFYVWDPMGLSPAAESRGEYDDFALTMLALLQKGADEKSLTKRLKDFVKTHMEAPVRLDSCEKTARLLMAWREVFANEARKKAGIPSHHWQGSVGIRRAEAVGPFASSLLVKVQGASMNTNGKVVDDLVLNALRDAKKTGLDITHAVVHAVARGGGEEWGAASPQGNKLEWANHSDPRVLMKGLGISVKERHVALKLAEQPLPSSSQARASRRLS